MYRPEIEPGPPAWEASTLEKSHLDSLLADYGTLLLHHNILHLKASKIFFTCLISILIAKLGTSSKKCVQRIYGLDNEFLLLKYLILIQCSNSTGV
jgi:hypothetical protein